MYPVGHEQSSIQLSQLNEFPKLIQKLQQRWKQKKKLSTEQWKTLHRIIGKSFSYMTIILWIVDFSFLLWFHCFIMKLNGNKHLALTAIFNWRDSLPVMHSISLLKHVNITCTSKAKLYQTKLSHGLKFPIFTQSFQYQNFLIIACLAGLHTSKLQWIYFPIQLIPLSVVAGLPSLIRFRNDLVVYPV